jgi:hypothetical protein
MGGIGKTQIAGEYVHRNKDSYHLIFWINAADQPSLLASFETFAAITGYFPGQDLRAAQLLSRVVTWLEQQQSWLLVFDNLEDFRSIQIKIPDTGPKRHIIITTRNHLAGDRLKVFLLDKHTACKQLLSEAELLPVAVNGPDVSVEQEAGRIVNKLGLLPLAIIQGAAYIREESHNIFNFLSEYNKHAKELLERPADGNWSYKESVATTFLMSFEKVRSRNSLAVDLLVFFSFLNSDGILMDFLQAGRSVLDPALQVALDPTDSVQLNKALFELSRYSLIERTSDGYVIVIHLLVQAVIRNNLTRSDSTTYMETLVAMFRAAFPLQCTNETRPTCRCFQAKLSPPSSKISHFVLKTWFAFLSRWQSSIVWRVPSRSPSNYSITL